VTLAIDPNSLRAHYQQVHPALQTLLHERVTRLQQLIEELGVYGHVAGRVKRFSSFHGKWADWQAGRRKEPITDLVGVRIVCAFPEDLERLVHVLPRHFRIVETDRKGEHRSYHEFGYDSVHLLAELPEFPPLPDELGVKPVFELQLRTILQDAWAEVEHELVYKSGLSHLPDAVRRKLAALNATLSLSDTIFQEIREQLRELKLLEDRRRSSLHGEGTPLPETLVSKVLPSVECEPDPGERGGIEGLLLAALRAHSDGEWQTAVTLYGQVLELHPDDRLASIVYNHRGMVWFVVGETTRALDDFSRALEHNPENYRALNNRSLAWRLCGQPERALADLDRSAELRPHQTEVYWNRSLVLSDQGDRVGALRQLDQVLSVDPEHSRARQLRESLARRLFDGKA